MNRRILRALASALVLAAATSAHSSVFFSEYVEGSVNNKALEIYNGTGAALNLSGYSVDIYFNGAATPATIIPLAGTVAPGDVYVLANSSATGAVTVQADQLSSGLTFNGNDAIVLRSGSTTLDVFGQVGFNPGFFWGPPNTMDNTLRRMSWVMAGDTNGGDAFVPALQWTGHGVDQFADLGFHTAAIPEPETYALLLAGLGLLGFAARRRRVC